VTELDALHTLPEHERKGAGTALLEWGIRLADVEGLPIRLLATSHGIGLYLRFGFVELGRVTFDLERWGGEGDFTWYLMSREPEALKT
jgi:GNAT superfamily N-acetyltransferase